jgi:hypothetical protein
VHLDEALLDHIEGIFLVTQEPVRHGIDLALVALHQALERLSIAESTGCDQALVVGFWGHHVKSCPSTGSCPLYSGRMQRALRGSEARAVNPDTPRGIDEDSVTLTRAADIPDFGA